MTAPTQNQTRKPTFIIGAGGHGRVVLDIFNASCSHRVAGFLDSNTEIRGRRIDGVPVLGHPDQLESLAAEHDVAAVIVAIGDNGIRRAMARRIDAAGLSLTNAIHPTATIAHNAVVGRNVVITAGVVVCANCQVGDSVILNTGCIADYQCMIGEGVHVCPGVRLAARVKVEPGAFVGIAATVVPRVCIGYEAVVGAGAVVLDDIPPMATAVGVPARLIRLDAASEEDAAMLLPAFATSPSR
ncbi:MAG: acetyltransferase [Phycisphaerales bacterium]|nr:acetyltransferase [Phycisphaerales bacterium]